MSYDVQSLEPRIRAILSAPGVDLATISAKRVRKQLMEKDSMLTMDIVKDNKEEIDALISHVYAEVSEAEQGSEEEETKSNKRRSRDDEDEVEGDEGEEEREAAPKKKKAKNGQEKSDEKLARKLSNEINGRATRAGKSRSNGTSKKVRGKKGAKSATTVDSDDEGDDDAGAKKKKRGGGGKGGFGKEYNLSEPLTALLQVDKMSRPQVVKGLWDYIKGNDLQNPTNKREIICDANLRAVFNVDKINMFQMNKVLGQHLHEPEAES